MCFDSEKKFYYADLYSKVSKLRSQLSMIYFRMKTMQMLLEQNNCLVQNEFFMLKNILLTTTNIKNLTI